jgi:hypothetical protein
MSLDAITEHLFRTSTRGYSTTNLFSVALICGKLMFPTDEQQALRLPTSTSCGSALLQTGLRNPNL